MELSNSAARLTSSAAAIALVNHRRPRVRNLGIDARMTHTDGAPAAQPSFQEFSPGDACENQASGLITSIVDVLDTDLELIGG
jgi:hypothetical protein